ncbi:MULTISPECIES: CHASE2 domain-containing protein [Deefgea]|uniref:CHASE2 domain-containing protein n=1 Tax=Deefgea chitinilytica TaxID=570276 RepID=A0ABS2CC61_9NEIS|nr:MULTISPECIES: adenylate/guanylate cyclase domain-containing protein [Deefgea]MBM5571627.1 CHASE2 domain-containing protein [Deefgea chitinilytica]MBM9888862.1 adenylate/guanylate cyclase domain-containing protein [Deefgea sp. CFH1-16]
MLRRHLAAGLSFVCIALLLMYSLGFVAIPALKMLDALTYDARMRRIAPQQADARVVIVDIDEASLATVGRWPWPRNQLAHLVDTLFDHYQIRALGFDMVFAEADHSSGLAALKDLAQGELKDNPAFLQSLQKLQTHLDYDAQFAQSLQQRRIVTGFYFARDGISSGALPSPLPMTDWGGLAHRLHRGTTFGGNLPQLMAQAGGHFLPATDGDGVTRRIPLAVNIQGAVYPALGLALAQVAQDLPPPTPVVYDDGASGVIEGIRLGEQVLPVDEAARALVPYRGKAFTHHYLSAADVLQQKIPLEKLQGKIVLLGTSAPGLNDLRATPMGESFPGVEVHANLVSGLLDGQLLHRPDYLRAAELLQLLVLSALLLLLLRRNSPLRATLATIILLALVVAINVYLWRQHSLDMPLSSSIALIAALYFIHMICAYFQETRHKQQLTQLFGQYVVPELVDKMSASPANYNTQGQSRELSVLFTDVRGFTQISEGMDAESLAKYMNQFLTGISTVIREGGNAPAYQAGTIDKYIGDCVMAFWGAPVADPQHARHAVAAALEIQAMLLTLNPQLEQQGWPPIAVGIGIHSGVASVGDMGSKYRMSYTAMGDTVNLASRIESLTKLYGVAILVSEATKNAAPEFAYLEIDRVRVLGKQQAVTLFAPVLDTEREKITTMQQFLAMYRSQDFDSAVLQLDTIDNIVLRNLYAKRIEQCRLNPPPADWDGVYELDRK